MSSLGDLPHTIHDAIALGLQFLAFQELPKDERPPRSIWFNTKRLEAHFEAVERRRDEKYGADGRKEIEDPVENEAARDLIVGD